MLSGFRVFSKRFVKTFPAQSPGFEIETELTIFALSSKMPIKEVETDYFARPAGSFSKLSTVKDALRVLRTIVMLIKEERPLVFCSMLAAVFALLTLICGVPLIELYLETGLVPRLPTAVLTAALMVCSVVSMLVGFVLDSVANSRKETRRQAYLRYPVVGEE